MSEIETMAENLPLSAGNAGWKPVIHRRAFTPLFTRTCTYPTASYITPPHATRHLTIRDAPPSSPSSSSSFSSFTWGELASKTSSPKQTQRFAFRSNHRTASAPFFVCVFSFFFVALLILSILPTSQLHLFAFFPAHFHRCHFKFRLLILASSAPLSFSPFRPSRLLPLPETFCTLGAPSPFRNLLTRVFFRAFSTPSSHALHDFFGKPFHVYPLKNSAAQKSSQRGKRGIRGCSDCPASAAAGSARERAPLQRERRLCVCSLLSASPQSRGTRAVNGRDVTTRSGRGDDLGKQKRWTKTVREKRRDGMNIKDIKENRKERKKDDAETKRVVPRGIALSSGHGRQL